MAILHGVTHPALAAALKRHFGYESFRPLQESIIQDSLDGRDVFALLPTGGGKSLCYQLPALIRGGLTVVVSPLIALMKDQVDGLAANGIAATFLNSTLGEKEARARHAGLHEGRFNLLYIAPERLMLEGFLDKVRKWSVSALAIDEAHCISEWGHDFRPEYRQLSRLRSELPGLPITALTATATGRVREDIISQLALREPQIYIASFNRPNLTYRVVPKRDAYPQLVDFIRQRRREAGIVYCLSRKSTESLAEKLSRDGFAARPYHAGLRDAERVKNQDAFLRDDVRIICATVAFGMGINKPNVRFVAHYDLPKNVEGYYQETGRAGRDGLPADCLLFFSSGDAVKYRGFIDDISDENERRIARAQLREMVHYAECPSCRRAALLSYFGEIYPEPNCGACDNCLNPRQTFDASVAAQKLISTILRARQASRSGEATFGINHHIDVLLGLESEKITRWGHASLSTYGIGTEFTRPEWSAIARELIRQGCLELSTDRFATIDVTPSGVEFLRKRTQLQIARPSATDAPSRRRKTAPQPTIAAEDLPQADALFEHLRELRKTLADHRGVPAYIILSDASLREMAQRRPTTEAALRTIGGIGEKKLADFGGIFLDAIRSFGSTDPG
jgi:ATP-dependent DNA helicase RecQ